MDSTTLINDLIKRTKDNLNRIQPMLDLSIEDLNFKPDPERWSILECIEHLNRYGDFYLPELETKINQSKHKANAVFKSGWLGNYFAISMLPKEKLNTMKTFKSMNPAGSQLTKETLHTFVHQQQQMLTLLHQARTVCLSKTKTNISISKWIKLRLGDTFRVVIYHNQRHLLQAEGVMLVS